MQYSNGEKYSVLMSVYNREKPENLRVSIESMMSQTLPPGEFVLVCDGELDEKLNDVIRWAKETWKDVFVCIRLKEHLGLGEALKEGVLHCKYSYIARMDSDDVSVPDRCKLQMQVMQKGNFAIVGGSVQEFRKKPGDMKSYRISPETQEEILEYAKGRNPFNHPCVMLKKEAVLAAGNYQDFSDFEDYHLWIRMLEQGARGYNLQKVLLYMRIGNGMYERRGGFLYVKSIVHFQKYMREIHYIGNLRFMCNCMLRIFMSIIPKCMREYFYRRFLR